MKTNDKPFLTLGLTCVIALCTLIAIGGPGCDLGAEDDADTTSPAPTDIGNAPSPDIRDTATQPPSEITDSVEIDGAGKYILLDGEITLLLEDGALDIARLEVTKTIRKDAEQTVIGYIWGPHGIPIDPPGALTITLLRSEVIAENIESLRILAVSDDGSVKELLQELPTIDDERITFQATLELLGDLVIGTPSS